MATTLTPAPEGSTEPTAGSRGRKALSPCTRRRTSAGASAPTRPQPPPRRWAMALSLNAMKTGASPRSTLLVRADSRDGRRPGPMLHVGLDLSRTRLDVHAMNGAGTPVRVTTAAPDAGGLASLVGRVEEFGQPVAAAIESMTGARFVHDQLELRGWEVQIADAVKVKGLAPLAAKTDKIDAWVLAELSRRDLVPAIWLPDPGVRAERERARWRLHLVRHRTALKNRIHAPLMAFGHPSPAADLCGAGGRRLRADLALPEPWAGDVAAALHLIDSLDAEIDGCEAALRAAGADHPYVPLLTRVPGIGPVLATPSPPRSVTSPGFRRRRSWSATPGCARRCASPAARIIATRWPRTGRSTCAGR